MRNRSAAAMASLKIRYRALLVLAMIFSVIIASALTDLAVYWDYGAFNHDNLGLGAAGMIFFVFATYAFLIPSRLWLTWLLPRFGAVSVAVTLATCPFLGWYGQHFSPASSEFFTTVAQVLPVLFLAAVVDLRNNRKFAHSQILLYISVIFLGELTCLSEIAFEARDLYFSLDFGIVSASILGAFAGLAIALLGRNADDSAAGP
jgi:hypothetical protein